METTFEYSAWSSDIPGINNCLPISLGPDRPVAYQESGHTMFCFSRPRGERGRVTPSVEGVKSNNGLEGSMNFCCKRNARVDELYEEKDASEKRMPETESSQGCAYWSWWGVTRVWTRQWWGKISHHLMPGNFVKMVWVDQSSLRKELRKFSKNWLKGVNWKILEYNEMEQWHLLSCQTVNKFIF